MASEPPVVISLFYSLVDYLVSEVCLGLIYQCCIKVPVVIFSLVYCACKNGILSTNSLWVSKNRLVSAYFRTVNIFSILFKINYSSAISFKVPIKIVFRQ